MEEKTQHFAHVSLIQDVQSKTIQNAYPAKVATASKLAKQPALQGNAPTDIQTLITNANFHLGAFCKISLRLVHPALLGMFFK